MPSPLRAERGTTSTFREAQSEAGQVVFRTFQVHFIGDDKPGLFGQVFAVKFDFRAEVLQVFNGVASFASGHVQNEDEHLAACDVAQEFVSQGRGCGVRLQ